MKKILGFAFVLATFWLINSGYFKPLLLIFGVLSVGFVIMAMMKMKKNDGESFPLIIPSWRLPHFLIWMIGEIVSSNIDVAKRVWLGKSAISPVIFKVTASQKSEVAKVLYANSITMTPGTITLSVIDNVFEVHALTRKAAQALKTGEMDRRVKALEAA